MEQEIISAGIDIGTTTSQVIFSRLTLENHSYTAIPDVKIAKKEILYKSPIHFTPLRADGCIDEQALSGLLAEEYRRAQLRREQVTTGAVIITGESSRKQNARLAVQNISALAGDFVVATAGPDLESVLAGYGAGAAACSKHFSQPVANFDIGGGTTNVSVFLNGELQDAFALDIGGRLVRLAADHRVRYISVRIQPLIREMGLSLQEGELARLQELRLLSDRFAEICAKICLDKPLTPVEGALFIGHANRPRPLPAVMFSGGVSECIYGPVPTAAGLSWDEVLTYGDIGPLVGEAFRRRFQAEPEVTLLQPQERIRATVIGAGSHAIHLSGSTVLMHDTWAPLKNIPVIRLDHPERPGTIVTEYRMKRAIYPKNQQVAIAFSGPGRSDYATLKQLAHSLVAATAGEHGLLLVVLEQDLAKALGLLMKRQAGGRRIICLDRIRALPGDYIDVGQAVRERFRHACSQIMPPIIRKASWPLSWKGSATVSAMPSSASIPPSIRWTAWPRSSGNSRNS